MKNYMIYRRRRNNTIIANQKHEMLFLNSGFKEEISRLNKKYNFEKIKKTRNGYKKLDKELNILFKKYNMPSNYFSSIRGAVVLGVDSSFEIETNLRIYWAKRGTGLKDDRLILEVLPQTTIKDIQGAWAYIKEQQKKLMGYKSGRRKVLNNYKRDKMIFNLSRAGKTHREIAKIINDKFTGVIGYEDVSTLLKRFKRKIRGV